MKRFLLYVLLLLYSCNTNTYTKNNSQKSDSNNSTTTTKTRGSTKAKKNKTPNEERDTTCKIGQYMVEGPIGIKVDLVDKNNPHKILFPCDTIYEDDHSLVVADKNHAWGFRIYKKYRVRFQFSDYKVDSVFSGKLMKPKNAGNLFHNYSGYPIKDELDHKGINFAGHYTIVESDCGACCQYMTIIDRTTGEIVSSKIPFDTLDGHCGSVFRKDSRLLIINTCGLDSYPGYVEIGSALFRKPGIYEFKDKAFKKLE